MDRAPRKGPDFRTEVAIVGAGPYGLSLAAHLERRAVPFSIFGPPMEAWRAHMPAGMKLKSDGFASNLHDPQRQHTLQRYCDEQALPYADYGLPVPVETFVAYGVDFQKKVVPTLDPTKVAAVTRVGDAFELRLADGRVAAARAVVLATGLSGYERVPEVLAALPAHACTHSSAHHDLAPLRGRHVAVVGGGASATDLAGLLHRAGARVELISRGPVVFHKQGAVQRSLWQRVRAPNLGLGPNFRSAVYTALPGLFHLLPLRLRRRIVERHLGPAGAWFMREHVEGRVAMHVGVDVQAAQAAAGGVRLELRAGSGATTHIEVDHVIAATGYRVSVDRLEILERGLREALQVEDQWPVLSGHFESSVPGLYFAGTATACSFGPVMRFAVGARYTAATLAARLGRRHARPAPLAREKSALS